MQTKSIVVRLFLPLALSASIVTEASALGGWNWGKGWGWDRSGQESQARQNPREGHHVFGGWATRSVGSTGGSSDDSNSRSAGGGSAAAGGPGGAGGSAGAGDGGAGGTGAGGRGGADGGGADGGAGRVAVAGKTTGGRDDHTARIAGGTGSAGATVGAPEIDGPAGLAALALLLSAAMLAFRRFGRA